MTPTPTATALPTPTPTPEAVSFGTLELRVTDAPAAHVIAAFTTFMDIEVRGSSADDVWLTIHPGPISLDLVATVGIEMPIASALLPAGQYSQLRLKVSQVIMTDEGGPRVATVPDPQLLFAQDFEVVADHATILVMDFDVQASFLFGFFSPLFQPVVELSVRSEEP